MSNVAVIGGGASGMLAAAFAAQNGHAVILFEKNEKLGKKLYITGKGRCNFTNAADISEFFNMVIRNPKFLYSAFYMFNNQDIISLVEKMQVAVKTERGGRVFPASDKSSDIIRALATNLKLSGAQVELNSRIESISHQNGSFVVLCNNAEHIFDKVILCTGGISYPATGSTGDGYRFAKAFGHTIMEPRGALVPWETMEEWPTTLSGLTLKNIELKVVQGKKIISNELGELLFTHFGVSGPLVLTASSLAEENDEPIKLYLDLKPGLTPEMLDARLLRDFSENTRKQLGNALSDLLPKRMIPIVIGESGLDEQKAINSLTKQERAALCGTLKGLPLTVRKTRPVEEAIITRGGVNVREVNSSTMESKLIPGLYFAGELLDVDALTGGYNLQIAFSTGALAGKSIDCV